jgi:proline iminopeptidase
MEALRRYLGLGTVISIGTSYGGMVAMAHAARYPTAVSHLILVVTAAHSGFIQRAIEIVTERGTVEEIGHCRDLFQGKVDTPEKLRRFFEGMGRMYSLKHDPTSFKHSLERCILTVDPLNRAFAPNGFLRDFDLRLELNAVRAPTLILAGRHDWICAPQFSEEIHRLILGSDLRIFEESSHFIGADEPQNLLDVITGFVIYQGASTEPRI